MAGLIIGAVVAVVLVVAALWWSARLLADAREAAREIMKSAEGSADRLASMLGVAPAVTPPTLADVLSPEAQMLVERMLDGGGEAWQVWDRDPTPGLDYDANLDLPLDGMVTPVSPGRPLWAGIAPGESPIPVDYDPDVNPMYEAPR